MQRIEVKSSQIKSIGYSQPERELEIEFQPRNGESEGAIYKYFDVAPGTYQKLMAASSIGSFFSKEIRGQYTYQKMGQDNEAAVKEICQRIAKLSLTKDQADTLIDAIIANTKPE